jgi:hypothetical protein
MRKVVYELRSVPNQAVYVAVYGTQYGLFYNKRDIASQVIKDVVRGQIVKNFVYREVDKTL